MADRWRTLSEDLAELERTNTEVKKAAHHYDRTVRRIVRGARTEREAAQPLDIEAPRQSGRQLQGGDA